MVPVGRGNVAGTGKSISRTYCHVDLSSLCDLFRENAKKFEQGISTAFATLHGTANQGQDILPRGVLNGQACETDADLSSDWSGTITVKLKQ
jgi:hypothetical protein